MLSAAAANPPAPPAARDQAEDFDAFWHALDEGYAYFGTERGAWKAAREKWRPRAVHAATRSDFVAALEGAISELRDDHIRLSERSEHSARSVPYETDVWARWKDGVAYVEAVRPFGDADIAGLRPGLVVSQVDGVPVEQAVRDRLDGGISTPRARDWALRHVLAGPRTGQQRITMQGSGEKHLVLDRTEPHPGGASVFGRRMGDERDIGYLRVRYGVDNAKVVDRFDAVLNYLDDTRALIIDIRDPPGPGDRAVTQALLARFATADVPWQAHEPGPPARNLDSVAPRGKPYRGGAVLVLVDHWTAGESEALAAGLRAVAGARIVGTRMAGLRGDLGEARLPRSGIVVRYPTRRTFLMNGEPREAMHPDVLIDLAAPQGGPGDPILYAALKLLEPCPGPACRSGPGSQPPVRGSLRR